MNTGEYRRRLSATIDELRQGRRASALRVGFDVLALVKRRVIGHGVSAEGVPFSPYSPKYAKRRAKKGRQISHVDFSFTARMWTNIRPFLKAERRNDVIVEIKAGTADNQRKINENAKRRGNFLIPSVDEQAIVARGAKKRILDVIRKNGII